MKNRKNPLYVKRVQINQDADALDIFADLKTNYGAHKVGNSWVVTLWQPVARNVELLLFDKNDQDKLIEKIKGEFKHPNWIFEIKKDVDGHFYQYEITQEDGSITKALDPYAFSMAAWDWNGDRLAVGKAAFVDMPKVKNFYKLDELHKPQPIMYEAHIRDLTSLRDDVKKPGSYEAIIEAKIPTHIKEMGYTTIQILPINQCFALNENDSTVLNKGEGKETKTNYNWGYDPQSYFAINGQYSSNPKDPYSRMKEFKKLVEEFHKNDIKVVVDTVYNHLFSTVTFNNVLPFYYHRTEIHPLPAGCPSFATERIMGRRIVVDSLLYLVETYDIDGIRFDLSTFIDSKTLEELIYRIRQIKPNFIFHGEAWDYTNLSKTNSYNKKYTDNDNDFAYFNDTVRNSIKGADGHKGRQEAGLIYGNSKYFKNYLTSLVGNNMYVERSIREKKMKGIALTDILSNRYDVFTKHINVLLNYSACHDGFTLWDKVNVTVPGEKRKKVEAYRQALMMTNLLPGRILHNQGTEVCYTKPLDESGCESFINASATTIIDLAELGNKKVHGNSYKTTDYTNGVRWNVSQEIKEHVKDFMKELNHFRKDTEYFNFNNAQYIVDNFNFNKIDSHNLIIDLVIKGKEESIRIIHNFGWHDYTTDINDWNVKMHSGLVFEKTNNIAQQSSVLLTRKNS